MNKKTCAGLTALAALGLTAATSTAFAQSAITSSNPFSLGDLVVSQVGVTGSTTALSSAATADVLDEFTTGGSLAGFLALPTATTVNTTNPNSFTNSGSATSEGALSLSGNGQYLLLGGYDASPGTASVVGTTSTADPREVAVVGLSGSVNLTAVGKAFSGNNIRGAASPNGTTLYASGATTPGLVSVTSGNSSTEASAQSTSTNSLNLHNVADDTVNGSVNLYYSTASGSGTARGIYQLSSPGTTSTATEIASDNSGGPAGESGSAYGFYFTPDGQYLYVADSGGSILKYSDSGSGAFLYNYVSDFTTNIGSVTGLTGVTTGSGATETTTLYGVNPTTLFSLTDTNGAVLGSYSSLATASTNTAFRGITFLPQAATSGSPAPEPSQVGMLALMGLGLGGLMLRARRRTVAA